MKQWIGRIAVLLCVLCLVACTLQPAPELKTELSGTSPAPSGTSPAPSDSTPPSSEPEASQPETTPSEPETEPETQPSEPETEPSDTEPQPAPTEPEPTEPEEPNPPVETGPGVWVMENGHTYYYIDGTAHTGWLELGSDRYYFHANGTMARGKVEISDSETRYFTSTGKEIILVNPWNYVPDDYKVTTKSYKGWPVADYCYDDLKQMINDCAAAGHTAVVVSSYRSNSYQAQLYERRVQRFMNEQGLPRAEAEIEAAKRVAIPGTSEHELGLAVDIVDENYQKLTEKQETMPAQIWLMENSWRYGFILRYPNGTTEHTGIIYEPWHYRYVGKELAAELHELGVCLEVYLENLTEGEANSQLPEESEVAA